MRGREISCPIQGHGSVHVLSRHHLLQENVSLPARRTVQALANTCRNTTTTTTMTNKHTHTEEGTHTHTHTGEQRINSAPASVCSRVPAIKNLQSLRVCR